MHAFSPRVITHNATFQEDLYYFSNLINLRRRKLSYVTIEKGFSLYKPSNSFNIFLLNVNFVNIVFGLHVLIISFILAKFQKYQRSIAMSSIKCLNFKFL